MNRENYQTMNDLDRARRLRQEAELLEYKERVRGRLRQIQGVSKDPAYDRYLAQMMKDLESGKATPAQVEREAERSYQQYRQKMLQGNMTGRQQYVSAPMQGNTAGQQQYVSAPMQGNMAGQQRHAAAPVQRAATGVEYKIGAQVFSMIGAIFVLVAFVIFGYNFLNGIWQGLCLYGAALVLVILSELRLLFKKPAIVNVTTGIGIGGLYIANIINYLVLHSINSAVAMVLTLIIAMVTVFISRKKDSTVIRVISLVGCYICLFSAGGIDTALEFLIVGLILLIINTVCIFFQNQTHRIAINALQLVLNLIFTLLYSGIAWTRGIGAIYLVFYVATAFVVNSLISLRHCQQGEKGLFILTCVANGICLVYLSVIGDLGPGIEFNVNQELFVHLMTDALIILVCVLTYLFWNHEDGRKWTQLYYASGVILLSGTAYKLETVISVLAVFIIVKILGNRKELAVLDCIVTVCTAFTTFSFIPFYGWGMTTDITSYIYYCLFAAILILSVVWIRRLYLFYEIFLSIYVLAVGQGILDWWVLPRGCYFLLVGIIYLLFFLIFNHAPWLKEKNQQPYNIFNVIVLALYYLGVYSCRSYVFSTLMMLLGAVTIIVVFRKRYHMAIPRKYLLLAGFLTFFSFTGHYPSPVVVSILLMIIALACVGIGFKIRDRVERICGLVLAIFVCVKLVLYDFSEVDPLYRVIVFFAVGILALFISFLYIILEKKLQEGKAEQTDSLQVSYAQSLKGQQETLQDAAGQTEEAEKQEDNETACEESGNEEADNAETENEQINQNEEIDQSEEISKDIEQFMQQKMQGDEQ